MQNLIIPATKYTPDIIFDCTNHMLQIKGESYPENTAEFYSQIFAWLENYLEEINDQKVHVHIDLIYFNSSSSKALINFFDVLESAAVKGKAISVNWYYEEDDEDILEFGKEFQEDLEALKFNLVQKNNP
ncbi:MAG: DUF1987 domain-containing protein [Desulfobacterales bacterium]|nr:DUF1987 domain-containing protein [Desulfobacterales bacterium]